MKLYLFLSIALALLVVISVAACSGGPTSTVPTHEPTTPPDQSNETPEATTTPPTEAETENATITPPPAGQTQEPTKAFTTGPEAPEATPPADAKHVVLLAQEDLANRLNLATEASRLVSVESVDWRDTSLGCPEPGMMYAQVITPGFRVVLEAQGQTYKYHTDTGRFVILCPEEGLDVVPLMPVAPHGIPGKPPVSGE